MKALFTKNIIDSILDRIEDEEWLTPDMILYVMSIKSEQRLKQLDKMDIDDLKKFLLSHFKEPEYASYKSISKEEFYENKLSYKRKKVLDFLKKESNTEKIKQFVQSNKVSTSMILSTIDWVIKDLTYRESIVPDYPVEYEKHVTWVYFKGIKTSKREYPCIKLLINMSDFTFSMCAKDRFEDGGNLSILHFHPRQ